MTHVILTKNGLVKHVKKGFSWTTLFFGVFPALFRGDLKWFLIQAIVHIIVASLTFGIGLIVTFIVFAIIYNDKYINDLIEKGWVIKG